MFLLMKNSLMELKVLSDEPDESTAFVTPGSHVHDLVWGLLNQLHGIAVALRLSPCRNFHIMQLC